MKSFLISAMILTATFSLTHLAESKAQKIHFEDNWGTALARAKAENKMLFVDFYASWCGPCIYLEKKVFTEQEVGNYFNEHYISVRIDAENEEQELVARMNIEAYPTLAFYNPDQEMVFRQVGALSAEELINMGRQVRTFRALGPNPALESIAPAAAKDYLTILKAQDFTQAQHLATALLQGKSGPALMEELNLFLLTNFVHDPNSVYFQYLMEHLASFQEHQASLAEYFSTLSDTLLKRAVTHHNIELLNQYATLLAAYDMAFETMPHPVDYYLLNAKARYYMELGEAAQGKEYYRQMIETYHYQDAERLFAALITWLDMMETESERRTALKWARQSYSQEKTFYTSYVLAHTLKEFNRGEALAYAQEALGLAENEENITWAHQQIEELSNP